LFRSGSSNLFHVSLHRDDTCLLTVRKDYVKYGQSRGNPNPPRKRGHPRRWKAADIAPGIKMPFRLLIPASELRPPVPGWNTTNPIQWLPAPLTAYAYEIRLYLGKEPFDVHSLDGDIDLLCQRPLVDGWELQVL